MTLLDDVIDGASGDVPIAQLLRRVKVLAARTNTDPLEEWVSHELDGYPEDAALPPYRGPFDVQVIGHYLGAFAELTGITIPRRGFPAEMTTDHLFTISLREPIAELESMTTTGVTAAWTGDTIQLYNAGVARGVIQRHVRQDLALAEATMSLSKHTIVGVIDTVRTKVLDLALQLEKITPDAGQSDASHETNDLAGIVINNHLHGPTTMVIGGSGNVTQTVNPPTPGNPDELIAFLEKAGLPGDAIAELRTAVAEDTKRNDRRWPKVRSWFGKAATDSTTQAVGGAIANAIGIAAKAFLT
jgi:hypothetical protein